MTPGLDIRTVTRRFLVLRATRWLPTGLLIPVLILFVVDRGLTLTQVGIASAAQGVMVMLLELPTGGFADAFGRRRVLLLANTFNVGTMVLLLLGGSLWWFIAAWACEGVYRALESGPLDAWFVDAVHEADRPDVDVEAEVERGLRLGGVVLGLAIAAGALASGAVVALARRAGIGDPLAIPFVVALVLRLVDTALIARLMVEIRPPAGLRTLVGAVCEVPHVVSGSIRLVKGSTVLALLIGVELTWGFGMAAFELLFPVRLADLVGSVERAGELMGPVAAVAWVASSVGAAAIGWFSARLGQIRTAAAMRVLQGGTVLAMGLTAGPIGAVAAYLACFVIHGAANPVHFALIHREAVAETRATVLSLNSLMSAASGTVGGIALGAIADRHGAATGMYVGAAVLAVGAVFYLAAGRARAHDEPPTPVPLG
jgi:MFS family permease